MKLTIVDQATLAEAGLAVKESVHACMTCRFSIQHYKEDHVCGARGYKDIQIYQLNIRADCSAWEAKPPQTQLAKPEPISHAVLAATLTSIFWMAVLGFILLV